MLIADGPLQLDRRQQLALQAPGPELGVGARREIERRLDQERRSWRDRVSQIIRIPARVRVSAGIGDVQQVTDPGAPAIRIVDQPDAPAYHLETPDAVYPYRQ